MRDPNCLPFPEPDSQEVATLAEAFYILNKAINSDYTIETAKQDAVTFIEYRNAVAGGFLAETGVVIREGVSFYMRSNPQTENE